MERLCALNLGCSDVTVASGWCSIRGQCQHLFNGVRLPSQFVRPITLDSREAQCDPAGVVGRTLNAVKRHFDDEFRTNVHDVSVAVRLARK